MTRALAGLFLVVAGYVAGTVFTNAGAVAELRERVAVLETHYANIERSLDRIEEAVSR